MNSAPRGAGAPDVPHAAGPSRRRWLAAAGGLVLAPAWRPAGARDDPPTDPRAAGPLDLAIAVQVRPADRPMLRTLMEGPGSAQFAQWRQSGLIEQGRLLFGRYADAISWDLLVLLHFAHESDLARWHEIERSRPGGLPAQACALATSIHTAPIDLMRQGRSDRPAARPAVLVVPYDYLVPTREYLRYAGEYLAPQADGWIAEGIVSRWGLYVARYGAGRPWSSLFVVDYRDDGSLGQRDRVMTRVRATLGNNATFRRWSQGKDKVRTEGAPVVADELEPA